MDIPGRSGRSCLLHLLYAAVLPVPAKEEVAAALGVGRCGVFLLGGDSHSIPEPWLWHSFWFQSGYGNSRPVPVRDRADQRGAGAGDEGLYYLVPGDPAEGRIKAAECRDGACADQIPAQSAFPVQYPEQYRCPDREGSCSGVRLSEEAVGYPSVHVV